MHTRPRSGRIACILARPVSSAQADMSTEPTAIATATIANGSLNRISHPFFLLGLNEPYRGKDCQIPPNCSIGTSVARYEKVPMSGNRVTRREINLGGHVRLLRVPLRIAAPRRPAAHRRPSPSLRRFRSRQPQSPQRAFFHRRVSPSPVQRLQAQSSFRCRSAR